LRYALPESFRDAAWHKWPPDLLAQIRLSVLLGYGFVLSLLITGGLSSFVAFVIGWHARKRIAASGGRLVGRRLAWWCIIVGGLGATLAPLGILRVILKAGGP
jgi:hypothetical protein